MNLMKIEQQLTMTSREIAELIEKQHSHIKVSAERLAQRGVIGTLAVREFNHNGNVYTEYLLNKRDSLVLVAQNCPEFTARIVDRWQAAKFTKGMTADEVKSKGFSRQQDEAGNNTKPYCWDVFGPSVLFGQEVSH